MTENKTTVTDNKNNLGNAVAPAANVDQLAIPARQEADFGVALTQTSLPSLGFRRDAAVFDPTGRTDEMTAMAHLGAVLTNVRGFQLSVAGDRYAELLGQNAAHGFASAKIAIPAPTKEDLFLQQN